jgi:hypothetical protein
MGSGLSEAPPVEKNLKVRLRFVIEPFEIGLETESKESEIGTIVASLVGSVQASQEKMTTAISSVDVSKFAPIRRKQVLELEDPLEKVAARLNVDVIKIKKVFLVEKEKVFIVCKRELFGAKGPGEKAALAMLYVYKYGLEKSPTHDEVNEAYEKIKFKRKGFGRTVKPNLINTGRISEDKETGKMTIEPRAIAETENTIREVLSKV